MSESTNPGRNLRAVQAQAPESERPDGKPAEERRGSQHSSPARRVVGYATVPQKEQRPNGGLRAQSETIASMCARRGLSLLEIVHEREPRGGHVLERPGLGYALARISAGEADGLVVADLARLTHSVPQLGSVLEWFLESDARLIAAAPGLDTEGQSGRLAVQTIIDLSKWEREWLTQRTREGMRAARRMGPPGVADFPELRGRIAGMRAEGMTLQAIADRLNLEGVPTVRGGAKWRPSSVQAAAGYQRPRASRQSGFLAKRQRARSDAAEDLAAIRDRLSTSDLGTPGPSDVESSGC